MIPDPSRGQIIPASHPVSIDRGRAVLSRESLRICAWSRTGLRLAAGTSVTVEMLQADVDSGAATNADGTINLVHYAAWIVREIAERGD